MKRIFLAPLFLLLFASSAFAQNRVQAQTVATCGAQALTAGIFLPITQDLTGTLCTGGTSAGSSTFVQGNVASGAADSGNPVKVGGKYNTTQPTFTTGQRADLQVTNGGQLLSHITGYVSAGADGIANTQMAWVGTDNASGSTDSGTSTRNFMAGAPYLFNGTTWDRARSIVGSNGVAAVGLIPSSASLVGIVPVVSAAVEGSHVIKGSSGNLYSLTTTTGGTAGFVMVFNATSAPADGPVTPAECVVVAANSTVTINYGPGPPSTYATGITAVFSSTGCFTKTISNTAFFAGKAS